MKKAFLLVGVVLLFACDSFSDPAVRLAYCMEEGVKKSQAAATSIQVNCDLKLAGNYVVVLHPAGEKTDGELLMAGVPPSALPTLRALRIGDHAAIYVLATDKQAPDSRTTYQNNFVRIERVMVLARNSQVLTSPVSVEIGGPATARVVQTIH